MLTPKTCFTCILILVTLGLITCNKGDVDEKHHSQKVQEVEASSAIFKSHIEFLGIDPDNFESNTIALPQDDSPFPRLSDYGFFKGPVHYLIPSMGSYLIH